MLGLGKTISTWAWVAHGKHPVASDFFTLGEGDSTTKAICAWLDRGYQGFGQKQGPLDSVSWRFWIKSPRKDALSFGLLKNSCDQTGRAYPLLFIGSGAVSGWGEHLDLLPASLEASWAQMEYLSVKRYEQLSQIKNELGQIPAPAGNWKKLTDNFKHSPDVSHDGTPNDFEFIALARKGDFFLPLPATQAGDASTLIAYWHMLLSSKVNKTPTAVFVGGGIARSALVVLFRSLTITDFEKLWNLSITENRDKDISRMGAF